MSDDGRRCAERVGLEYDHVIPLARGGRSTVDNTRLLCSPHNQLEAERVFGEKHMREQREAERVRREKAGAGRAEAERGAWGRSAGSSIAASDESARPEPNRAP